MKKKWMGCAAILGAMIFVGLGLVQPFTAWGLEAAGHVQPQTLSPPEYTDQLIVKYREPAIAREAVLSTATVNALSATAGIRLTHLRAMSGNGHVLKLPRKMSLTEAAAIAERLSFDPDVAYVEPDRWMYPMLVPNDPQYANQWHYQASGAPDNIPGGANLPGAWSVTTGSSSIVVAVIDTGIVAHADLTGRTVPGYNFINNAIVAGNGIGRSSDPSDLGDWVAANYCYSGSPAQNSSWHGTHVSGTIGAKTNNSLGVAGINWASKILPVRVLGHCGGYSSDIVDGARWAVGLPVTGVPANANPAKVLNLSLGGSGACSETYQEAFEEIIAAGATVVVAAGNANADVVNTAPANCTGVISVAAVDRTGGRAYYSNYGTLVKIAAPGGAQSYAGDPNGVLSTLNTGTTSPVASPGGDIYQYYQGTSMATPHVSGIVSLMLSRNPTLTSGQILSIIQNTARTFPTGTGSDCTTSLCGAGIIDAAAAVGGAGGASMLWRNPTTGANYVWYMNGVTFVSSAQVMTISSPWVIAGASDFNGDGWPDILWRNPTTGENYLWYMRGSTLLQSLQLFTIAAPWAIVGVGDFNADGKPDILWRNSTTGENYVWYMDGGTFLGSAQIMTAASPWAIVGVGDFNADGKPDILWRNPTTGENYVWYMNGTAFLGSAQLFTIPSPWVIAGASDFNGDGKPDILWRNATTGENYVWYMNGTTFLGSAQLFTIPAPWQVAGMR